MLGLLHRVVLGEVSEQLRALFPIRPFTTDTTRPTTRLDVRRHKFQFVEPTFHTDVLKRSIFGLTVVYNLLPAEVVESKSVQSFQSLLQLALRRAAADGIDNWQRIYAPDCRPLRAVALQRLFRWSASCVRWFVVVLCRLCCLLCFGGVNRNRFFVAVFRVCTGGL